MTLSKRSAVVLLMFVVTIGVAPASAQTPGSARPFSQLFGSTSRDNNGHQLSLMLSLAEGYNDDTAPELGNVIDANAGRAAGLQTLLVANGHYAWQGTRGQVAANTSSALAYYNDLRETRNISHTAALGFALQLSPQTSLLANQTAAYSPSYLYGLFPTDAEIGPGEVPSDAPDYSLQTRQHETYSYDTSMVFRHNLTRRNRLSATGDFRYADVRQETNTQRDMKVAGIRGEFTRGLTRNTAITVGYRYRHGQMGFGLEPTMEQAADVGMEHGRPLSATRRASIGFRLGVSSLSLPKSAEQLLSASGQRYFVDGELNAAYQFSGMWQVRAIYRRSLEYVPALTEPVFTDGFRTNLDAVFTRRLDLLLSAGYSNGASAFQRETSKLKTYTGDVRLRYALNRKLAAYVQYMYYFYDFSGNVRLAPGLPPQLERNAVRAGVMVWLPALQR